MTQSSEKHSEWREKIYEIGDRIMSHTADGDASIRKFRTAGTVLNVIYQLARTMELDAPELVIPAEHMDEIAKCLTELESQLVKHREHPLHEMTNKLIESMSVLLLNTGKQPKTKKASKK
jgi:hypothetical protein